MKNDRSLFAPAPRRRRGLILTLTGSLLFHGSLIGVAALWPVRPPTPVPSFQPVDIDPGLPTDPRLPDAPAPAESEPEAPALKAVDPVEDQPPAAVPEVDDMTLATPTPRPATARTTPPPRPASTSLPTVRPFVSRMPGNGSTGAATGSGAGAGRTGGVRWNVPRPAYPSALRLAHVQGSGSVRVTTDGAGRVVSAVIVQSTGNLLLDDHTCETAKTRWSGPPNTTTTVPITYQLQ